MKPDAFDGRDIPGGTPRSGLHSITQPVKPHLRGLRGLCVRCEKKPCRLDRAVCLRLRALRLPVATPPFCPCRPLAEASIVLPVVANANKITPDIIVGLKRQGQRIAALTAYDYPMTRLLDECGVPFLLVGDSLGMVTLGYPNTTHVTMAEMEHHVRAAARAKPNALLAADLPFHSYETPEDALQNARRLIAAGADAVKAEGGRSILNQIRAIRADGIPFIGHLGMLPQHVLEEGGYKIKGRNEGERETLLEDARALEAAGAFAIVLELVTPPVAKEISVALKIPTIGIGSGPDCDGQILVTHDLIGTFPWFTPKFVKPQLNAAELMQNAVRSWHQSLNP
jgi:3-methyl-2-oxobutanoate hydroxymethyltransferase